MKLKRITTASIAAIYVVAASGCATPGTSTSSADSGECNATGAALVGGLLGAALGIATKGGAEGAAIGAGVGALVGGLGCIAINANTKQTASAEQVRQQYQTQYRKPPEAITVMNYSAVGQKTVQRGNNIQINTLATVVTPQNTTTPKITEKIELSAPNNQGGPATTKPLAQNGGGFEQSYTVPIPKGAPGGVWTYKTTLFIDGKPQRVSTGTFTVV
jgi:hypothetical protein